MTGRNINVSIEVQKFGHKSNLPTNVPSLPELNKKRLKINKLYCIKLNNFISYFFKLQDGRVYIYVIN